MTTPPNSCRAESRVDETTVSESGLDVATNALEKNGAPQHASIRDRQNKGGAQTGPVAPKNSKKPSRDASAALSDHDGLGELSNLKWKEFADYLVQALRELKAEGTNGWVEIASALKDVDEDKIGHCKEDIDTLLVFAGLFSAVLTAFVVDSYQNLSPDPQDQVIQLLAQIAMQTSGYTITSSHINATTFIPGSSLPFEPSAVAVGVNRLWFISLLLSLITASFGILVKQWLREYRSVNSQHSNLRSRLRIRQFRYPALLKWKVFELAALLPLLIQLALGLFLLGLCLFTWSINASIGRSSVVLVSAWLFFFAATAFAPVLSSDCPYKISLFAPILPTIRSSVAKIWCLKWLYLGPTVTYKKYTTPWFTRLRSRMKQRMRSLRSALSGSSYTVLRRFGSLLSRRGLDTRRPSASARYLHYEERFIRYRPLEEVDIATNDRKDLDMLSAVDDILLDDELLITTMRSVITRSQFDPDDTILFVRRVLARRIPQVEERLLKEDPIVVDLSPLPSHVWDAIIHIIHGTLRVHAPQRRPGDNSRILTSPSWMNEALAIVLSRGIDDSITRNYDLAILSCYERALPKFSYGTMSKVQCRRAVSYIQQFFDPASFSKPQCITQIIHANQEYVGPNVHIRGHRSFSTYSAFCDRSTIPWFDPDSNDTVFSSVGELLFEWAEQRTPVIGSFTSDFDTELLQTVDAAIQYASNRPHRTEAFVQQFFNWVEEAPWTHVSHILNTSCYLASNLAWMFAGFHLRKLMWIIWPDHPPVSFRYDIHLPLPVEPQTRALRVIVFAFSHYLKHDVGDVKVSHGVFPAMLCQTMLELWDNISRVVVSSEKDNVHFHLCEDEWTAIFYLLGNFVTQYHELIIQGRAVAVDPIVMCDIRNLSDRIRRLAPDPAASYITYFHHISECWRFLIEDLSTVPLRSITRLHDPSSPEYPRLAPDAADKAEQIVVRILHTFEQSSNRAQGDANRCCALADKVKNATTGRMAPNRR